MVEGLVIKKVATNFWVKLSEETVVCSSPKKQKAFGVFVGDKVLVDVNQKIIVKVKDRKNLLIRPPVANLSQLIIVISDIPKPDFYIIDKLILFSLLNDIKPILCVSKTDALTQDFVNEVHKKYNNVLPIIETSAHDGNISSLTKVLKDNLSALAGQSAVGKSALTKALFPNEEVEIGELSKIERGKNTTRHCQIFSLDDSSFLIDTPGFTSLDETLLNIPYFELPYYYPDFIRFHENCKYKSCTHTAEDHCGIKEGVKNGEISKDRYERYKIIFENLKKEWVKKHG